MEVVLEGGHGAEAGTPDDVAEGIRRFRLDALHEGAGAGSDALDVEARRHLLGDVQRHVDDLDVVRCVDDSFGGERGRSEGHGRRGKNGGGAELGSKAHVHGNASLG